MRLRNLPVLLNSDLTSSEHFYTRGEMVAVLGEHHPGHRPNDFRAAGGGNWIFDCQFNVYGQRGNGHRAECHRGNLNQRNDAFGKPSRLFHQSASEQQQRLTRKRWFGVDIRGLEKFMDVSSVLDQFVSIRNCEQSFGRVQDHWHAGESIAIAPISKETKVQVRA